MSNRQNFSSGAKWEDIVGYCRMVKSGSLIWVSGTVAADDNGNIVGLNDVATQVEFIIQKIEKHLARAGATLKDVVRTRLFVTDISKWEEIGKAHGKFFMDIKPVTTMVEVRALIHPDYLIEMDMDVII